MDRPGLKYGFLAGLLGIGCCVGPTVLALVGALSVAAAIDLGQVLYYVYGWYFRGAAILFAALLVIRALRARKACTLGGVRAQWRLVATVIAAMTVTYAALYGLTSWLARSAS
jgi:hypothetical protein